jgi:hypothetical protein
VTLKFFAGSFFLLAAGTTGGVAFVSEVRIAFRFSYEAVASLSEYDGQF